MKYYARDQIPPKELMPGITARLVHSDQMTVAHWHFDADAPLPSHSHPHEQIVNVIEGVFDFVVDGDARRLTAGDIVVVPSNVVHSGHSITECYIIDVFHPAREDYK